MAFHSLWIRPARARRAFTLIELLAVAAIIIIITAIVLANNNRFGGVVQLQNLAYDIALSVREAQVYGISVSGYGTGQSQTFQAGYGVHFAITDPDHFELFGDAAGSGIYQPSENVPPSPYTIQNGNVVSELCYTPSTGGAEVCDAGGGSPQSIDAVFLRPEPDALISIDGNSCEQNGACESSARIVITSPSGDSMSVIIDSNGQISVTSGS